MKPKIIWLLLGLLLVGCGSGPSFSVDKQVWVGQATRTNTPDTYVKITFSQSGENVEGILEIGPSEDRLEPPQTLKGTLKGTTLAITTETSGDTISGTFNENDNTFSGTLTLLIEDSKDDFVLTMSKQSE